MGVGITRAIERDKIPVLIATQQIAVGRRGQSRTGDVVVLSLSGIKFKLLFEVAAMFADVTDPESGLERHFVFNGAVPGLNSRVLPITGVPDRSQRSAG